MEGLFGAWFVEGSIITWRSFTREHRPPLPSEFVASFVIFGLLGLAPPAAKPAATALGWGLVVATVLRLGPADFNQAGAGIAGRSRPRSATVTDSFGDPA